MEALKALYSNGFSMARIYGDDILMIKRVNATFVIRSIQKRAGISTCMIITFSAVHVIDGG